MSMTTTTTPTATARVSSMKANSSTAVMLSSQPALIVVPPMRFLVMDAPRQANLHLYIKEMKKLSVSHVVRVCDPTYTSGDLESAGICLHEMEYADGHAPSPELIHRWLKLVEQTFFNPGAVEESSHSCIAVHCVAGLGRAPVMVAIAFIEFAMMDPVEAVALIRRHRRGAINEKQLIYLEGYKRSYKRTSPGAQDSCCVIL